MTIASHHEAVVRQVPWSQEARYFSCASVSVSMLTPLEASLRRAISRSISSGTG